MRILKFILTVLILVTYASVFFTLIHYVPHWHIFWYITTILTFTLAWWVSFLVLGGFLLEWVTG